MKNIFLIVFLCSLSMFGQDKNEELRLVRHPLPEKNLVTKLYLFDILQEEGLVDTIALKIFLNQHSDLTKANIKRKQIKLYEDINVWEVRYFLGYEKNDSILSNYFIRFNKNTVEVIDHWIEK
ncbi:hypothetical protein HX004_14245 [Myroides sp. 1354]|uniref:hypothetical protein n=1 Tax=unclassified Myroides TaxID=2642485 RepID=UPI002577B463|nr:MULTISPECIES: hypothetical protein [unclassified Myroides]MDM1045915.1 hypothetical protein [Myroides sp. R163-1]MDM1056925.1 hypothetical protein [Myroides sp. 1354]MDM1070120.1 hypothetical protein [Myroides sp. 1372]